MPPKERPLTPKAREALSALVSGPVTQKDAGRIASLAPETVGRIANRQAGKLALSEVHAASLREASLTAGTIKRRLWLLSHAAEEMGQFAPAVSVVVALHRDIEAQGGSTTVNVQVIRIGGRDIHF